jgi:SAM-dependent methyltransferase
MRFAGQHAQQCAAPVLEVGSCNVNGSVRELFPTPYTGIDIVQGPGVDIVVEDGSIPFEDETFATVVSTEMLEHALDPVFAFMEMVRVLKPGGILLVTARGNGFPRHNPPDRWRLMPGTLRALAAGSGLLAAIETDDPQVPGYFLVAKKAEA